MLYTFLRAVTYHVIPDEAFIMLIRISLSAYSFSFCSSYLPAPTYSAQRAVDERLLPIQIFTFSHLRSFINANPEVMRSFPVVGFENVPAYTDAGVFS
jgi:hypothetical protein